MKSILVVDDEQQMRDMICKTLERAGYQVRGETGGRAALQAMEEGTWSMLITDIFMPEMGGIELLWEMQGRGAAGKVLAISGGNRSGFGDALAAAGRFGADRVLDKPFTLDTLRETVTALIGPATADMAPTGLDDADNDIEHI